MSRSKEDILNDAHNKNIDAHYKNAMLGESQRIEGKIGFTNFGYWNDIRPNLEIANISLIEELIEFFSNRNGNILDVACGVGASTKYLMNYFCPDNIIGINISEIQLSVCETVAPQCTFKLSDATSIDFGNETFDNMLCIEAAFHFKTRKQFLAEAVRVLKPGGRLAMSDVIFDKVYFDLDYRKTLVPAENYVSDLASYKCLFLEAGFRYARIEDITKESVGAKARYWIKKLEQIATDESLSEIEEWNNYIQLATCCLAFAIK